MKMFKCILKPCLISISVVLILCINAPWLKAQSAGEKNEICVSLQGIVELALKHNIKLKSLSREEKAAEAVVEQTRAQRLPLFSVDAKSMHYTGLTSFEIRSMLTIPEIENRYNIGASISQPLYTGGKLRSMRHSTELVRRSVGADQKAAESTAILDSITAYWNWSKAYYQLETLKSAIKRMEAHVKDMRNFKNAGMATENELLSTEVLFEQTKQRYEEALRRLDLVRAWIEFLTGEKTPQNWIPVKPLITTNILVPAEQELIATALKMRNERAAQILRVQAMEEKIKTAESEYYPQVSLVARYEQARPNLMNFPLRDRWQDDAFAGIVITWNLFDWGLRNAKVREAMAKRDQSHLALEQLDDQIFYEVRSARIKLLDAINRLLVSQRILEKAATNFFVANDLWKNGLARHSDVLDAHAQLTEAQFNGVSDSADIEIAKAQLEYAIGMLSLERIKSVK